MAVKVEWQSYTSKEHQGITKLRDGVDQGTGNGPSNPSAWAEMGRLSELLRLDGLFHDPAAIPYRRSRELHKSTPIQRRAMHSFERLFI
jgi:hypothetical protein